MNEELAQELVKEIGGGKTKFFQCNVLETEKGSLDWVKETGKEVGGVIAAAGVSTPAKVCYLSLYFSLFECFLITLLPQKVFKRVLDLPIKHVTIRLYT